jgi:arylsulfatase A-like enzyme
MGTHRLSRREFVRQVAGAGAALSLPWALPVGAATAGQSGAPPRPNIVLCMTDDQGWGDTGYNGHPFLKTPHLDDLAASGVRFTRFYAAAPVCSPTRGSVMTGRHPNRFGCFTYGRPIRIQEVTIAEVLKTAGYATGHFGKWHLNGKSGAGKPILADDPLSPGKLGFDEWLSATNYFDLDPSLGRNGEPVKFTGDGSDIIVEEALGFIRRSVEKQRPFLAVVWYGSPHDPHRALAQDRAPYAARPPREQNYYGELTAVDRSLGRLRSELRRLGIAEDTLLWFTSDNGGAFGQLSTGGLRGGKATLWEGGIRVPGLIEWPARIKKPFTTEVPAFTSDIYPTIVDLLGITVRNQVEPLDGISLAPLLGGKMASRPKPMAFWVYGSRGGSGHAALIDNQYKLHLNPAGGARTTQPASGPARRAAGPAVLLYDLVKDPKERTDLVGGEAARVESMQGALVAWQESVRKSLAGGDYKA